MKKSKIIVPALGILVLSTAASITGTVAWFSVNNSVTVDGMAVKTKVASNMLISADNVEANFGSALTQSRVATLEPASSVDGEHFFYTAGNNVASNGDAKTDTYTAYNESTTLANSSAGKEKYDSAYQTAMGLEGSVSASNVYYGYVDYSFYLKATNGSEDAKEIRMTKCNLLYNAAALTGDSAAGLAWRVGVFAVETSAATTVADSTAAVSGNLVSILTLSGAANFTSGKAIASTTSPFLGDVTYNDDVVIDSSVAAGATEYEKVIVRLWLEGEDTSCTNETFAKLTKSWTLDLAFSIDGTTSAVDGIDSVAA